MFIFIYPLAFFSVPVLAGIFFVLFRKTHKSMLDYLFLIIGITVILMVVADFAVTVFVPKGAGFITEAITVFVAKIFKFLSGNIGIKKVLEYKLVFIIAIMIISWLLLVWFSVSLIYSFDYNSIVNAETKVAATFSEKIYFTGYTISTLGLGDFQPNGLAWEFFTSMVSLLGFIILTISITYIVPVINSIIEKQTLSLQIASLGQTTSEILVKGYNGKDFSDLSDDFSNLSNAIFKHAKNHSAYPVLHHVHDSNKNENTILKLTSLDEACTILLNHVPAEKRIHGNSLDQLRSALTYYLRTVRNIHMPDEQPPPPVDNELNERFDFDFIHTSETELFNVYDKLKYRRCMLKALVEDDGFKWQDTKGKADTYFPESFENRENKKLKK